MERITQGTKVRFKPEWADGDTDIVFVVLDVPSLGRCLVEAQVNLPIRPTQIVRTEWLDVVESSDRNERQSK